MTTKECSLTVGEAAEAPGSRASVTGLLCHQLGKVAHLCRSRGLLVLDPMLICLRPPPPPPAMASCRDNSHTLQSVHPLEVLVLGSPGYLSDGSLAPLGGSHGDVMS